MFTLVITHIGIIEDSSDSLFTYHRHGESWGVYYDPDYMPLFEVKMPDPSTRDELCMVDITAANMNNKLSISLDDSDSFDKITNITKRG